MMGVIIGGTLACKYSGEGGFYTEKISVWVGAHRGAILSWKTMQMGRRRELY